jgi:hypothetical protein
MSTKPVEAGRGVASPLSRSTVWVVDFPGMAREFACARQGIHGRGWAEVSMRRDNLVSA